MWLAVVVSLLLIASSGTARATIPCDCLSRWRLPTGDTLVPLNAHFFLAGSPAPTTFVKVVGTVETAVAFTVTPAGDDAGSVWVIPDAQLDPNTTYRLGDSGFVTGNDTDRSPPMLASVVQTPGVIDGSCAEYLVAGLATTGTDDMTPMGEWLLKVVVSDGVSQRVVFVPGFRPILAHFLAEDWMTCGKLDIAAEGKTFTATVTAYDWAGHASTSVVLSIVFRKQGAASYGGCAVGAGAPRARVGGLILVLALGAAAAMRRRKRQQRRG